LINQLNYKEVTMKKAPIPEVGRTYNCFDDGKIRQSRLYQVNVCEVIPFEKCDDKEILDLWKMEVEQCYWLYAPETDYFVIGIREDSVEIFVRTLQGDWFGIGGIIDCGSLDVDGSLYDIMEEA